MWTSISVGILSVAAYLICARILTSLLSLFKHKYNTEFKKQKYIEDTRLKIEEPVRPVALNDEMRQEIASIKSQLTGLSMAKGMRGLNGK